MRSGWNSTVASVRTFRTDGSGVTAVEYGLIIAIIGSVILAFTADVQSGFEGIRKILASGFGS